MASRGDLGATRPLARWSRVRCLPWVSLAWGFRPLYMLSGPHSQPEIFLDEFLNKKVTFDNDTKFIFSKCKFI